MSIYQEMKDQVEKMAEIHKVVKSCIIRGDFILHSGERSTWLCDLLLALEEFPRLIRTLRPRGFPVGIEFGGVLLAAASGSGLYGIVRKDSSVYFPRRIISAHLCLIDDVCTTGESFKSAERALKSYAVSFQIDDRICVLDRRDRAERERYPVRSLLTWEDVMESRL